MSCSLKDQVTNQKQTLTHHVARMNQNLMHVSRGRGGGWLKEVRQAPAGTEAAPQVGSNR